MKWVALQKRRALMVLTALCLASCQPQPDAGAGPEGRVVLALAIPGGVTISSADWTVKSSSSQVIASGTINTARAGASLSFAVGVSPGKGDTVTMTAATSVGTTCSGSSSPFDVVANQTSAVAVSLNCQALATDGGIGSVAITGTVVPGDNCPVLASWTVSPETAAANGGQVDVTVLATDADSGDTLTYKWSAASGTFAAPGATNTTYTCGAAGSEAFHVTISDGHSPVPCTIDVALPPIVCN